MVKRTKKDVRRFGERGSFVDDESMYGSVEFDNISESRLERLQEHEWIDEFNQLKEDGKAILLRWNQDPVAEKSLNNIGAPKWISEARSDYDLYADEVGERSFYGLPVLNHSDSVPDAIDYMETECRDGKSYIEIMCHMMGRGHHLMLKGHAGTGKSGAAKYIASQTKRNVSQVNFSEEVRMQHLFGHFEVHSDGEGNIEQEWVDGVLTERAKDGGIFIADEANMMPGDTSSALHSALEHSEDGTATLTIPSKGETINVHPEFRVVATINPRYSGTNKVNMAFGDRFHHMEFEYLPQEEEVDIVTGTVDIDERTARNLVKVGRELRDDFREGTISKTITPRSMIRAADLAADGFMSPEAAAKSAYMDRFDSEDKSPVEKKIETTI